MISPKEDSRLCGVGIKLFRKWSDWAIFCLGQGLFVCCGFGEFFWRSPSEVDLKLFLRHKIKMRIKTGALGLKFCREGMIDPAAPKVCLERSCYWELEKSYGYSAITKSL